MMIKGVLIRNILHSLNFKKLPVNPVQMISFYQRKPPTFLDGKSKDIPIIPQENIFSIPVSPDINFLQKQYNLNLLKQYQKAFYDDVSNPQSAYLYIRQLNRLGLYQQISTLNTQTIHANLQSYKEADPQTTSKLEHQIEIGNERYRSSLKTQAMDGAQQQKRRGIGTYYLTGVILFLFYQAYKSYFEDDGENRSIFRNPFNSENNNENNQADKPHQEEKPKKNINSLMNILQGKTEVTEEKNITTRFSDVLGIDEFKEELEEIVDYLKNPKKYTDSGAKLPKGLLLVGPPGTGKTLLARALAGEAHCAFFYKSGAEFDEMFVGVGASRVRDLFKKARERAPSIIFIDEIDSIGGNRNQSSSSHSRDTINQILTEMDGFKQSESVIIIGATNFEQSLDPAIKRPGRFDKIIHIPAPDIKGRAEIFNYYLKKIQFDPDVESKYLARQTSGFTGADIQNMVNVAILNAIKNSRKIAQNNDFEFALDRIRMGVGRTNLFVSEKDKLLTAYHEGGHALTSLLTEGATPLHKVTILPRGGALGFTSMVPETDMLNYTRKTIIASIDVAMGGRAAEEIFVGHDEVTSGCSSDLQQATNLAYMYVRQLGMQDKISLISATDKIKTSEKYDYMVDMEVKSMLQDSYQRVKKLLKTNEPKLKSLALELIKKETLSAKEVKLLLQI